MTTSSKNTNIETHDLIHEHRAQALLDSIRKLLRRKATASLKKIIAKSHPADLVFILRRLDEVECWDLFQLIDDHQQAAAVLSEMGEDEINFYAERLTDAQLLDLLQTLPADDLADLVGHLPEERSDTLLNLLKSDQSTEIEKLLNYPEDSAGGIMSPDFFALHEDMVASKAIEAVQMANNKEMVFYIYVTDSSGHLVGVISLRQLLQVDPNTKLSSMMRTDVLSVTTDTDQEDAARIVARHNILAIPVVSSQNKLVGIITVDDIIDVIREEATEDILKMVGAGEDLSSQANFAKSLKARMPWLITACFGGVISAYIINSFEHLLSAVITVAGFIPIIIGMGGNIGAQSSTLVVRSLATKRVDPSHIWMVLGREIRIALTMGLVYGFIVALIAAFYISDGTPMLGAVVGTSLCISMLVSACIGTALPMIFERLHIDPAVATGPFVMTATDVLGILVYFIIATQYLIT